MGFPFKSSAKIQPTDHISTAGPYFVAPSSNSGGLPKSYQSEPTKYKLEDAQKKKSKAYIVEKTACLSKLGIFLKWDACSMTAI